MTARQDHNLYRVNVDKEHIIEVQAILMQWNPLGNRASQINDLNNYETEATDIIFHITTNLHFPKEGDPLTRTQRIIREVLNGAFNLFLKDDDCKEYARRIITIIEKK